MEEDKDNLKVAISFLFFNAVAADGEIDDKEIVNLSKSKIYEKFSSDKYIKKGVEFQKDLEITERISQAFEPVNSGLSKSELKQFYRDIIDITASDGEIHKNEETLLSLYSDSIDLSEKEIETIYKKWNADLKKEIENLQSQNDLAIALGFIYFWVIAADGVIADEEINTLNDYNIYKKYSGGGAVNNDFNKDLELGDRFKAAFEIVNSKLSNNELKELFYEVNKLMFADYELDENEKLVFQIIAANISLTNDEQKEAMEKFTNELKDKVSKQKEQNSSPEIVEEKRVVSNKDNPSPKIEEERRTVSNDSYSSQENDSQKKSTMAIVCFFVGGLGVHRFMMGYTGIGILMLLTGGLFGILALIDFVRILTGSLKMADGRELI
tara:strand:- start:1513 stop:2658 length:1146 start_codon:yes stop_codon:yes gene_type:complete